MRDIGKSLPPQVLFLHCRHGRCGTVLKAPADNPFDAFCCSGCEKQYNDRHCRVCGTVISPPKTKPRKVCWRSRCKHFFQRHPERYFGSRYPRVELGQISSKTGSATPTAGLGQISSRSAHSTGLKTGLKSGRGWRIVAGPGEGLHPINLQVGPDVLPRTHAAPALFKRTTMPANLVGGYRFPNAPQVDLSPPPPPPPPPTTPAAPLAPSLHFSKGLP